MAKNFFDLEGKVALVTGGNGGIGLGLAEGLAAHGAKTVIWGRSADKNAQAEEALKKLNPTASAMTVDVADQTAVDEAFAKMISEHGRVDAVFANAARVQNPTPFLEQSREMWEELFETNLWGVRSTLMAAARHMVERSEAGDPGGSLVSVGSLAGMKSPATMQAYGVSKAAIHILARSLAKEYGRYGIRSNAIIPGYVETPLTLSHSYPQEVIDSVNAKTPLGCWGVPDDFSAIAVYLASDHSRFHTADQFVIDGGLSVVLR